MAGCAHRALLTGIQPDGRLLYLGVWDLVDVGNRADRSSVGGAWGAPRVNLVGGEGAILIAGNLDFAVGRRPVTGRRELIGAVEHQLHRRARFLGEFGGDLALDVRAELAAEAAAHVMGDALHFRRRDLEVAR